MICLLFKKSFSASQAIFVFFAQKFCAAPFPRFKWRGDVAASGALVFARCLRRFNARFAWAKFFNTPAVGAGRGRRGLSTLSGWAEAWGASLLLKQGAQPAASAGILPAHKIPAKNFGAKKAEATRKTASAKCMLGLATPLRLGLPDAFRRRPSQRWANAPRPIPQPPLRPPPTL